MRLSRSVSRPASNSSATLSLIAAVLLTAWPARGQLILSEAMADPSAVADAQGEFLEIANAGAAPERADSLLLVIDGDTARVAGKTFASGEYLLICRDS